ncbi:MAG: DsrE family protein [Clostridia bacterium]|nr:DsrE family protein [Clostridia bacterium]
MSTINILWTTESADTALLFINEYAEGAVSYEWWDKVRVILWGGSIRLIQNNSFVQVNIMRLVHKGVEVVASKNCADTVGATELLESLEVEVKYMGKELTEIMKDKNQKLITV